MTNTDLDTLLTAVRQPGETGDLAAAEIRRRLTPPKYSPEWVRQKAGGKQWLDHHNCALCNVMVGYHLTPTNVSLNTNCDCVSYHVEPRPSSYEEIAHWLAMQHSDEIRDKIMDGLR